MSELQNTQLLELTNTYQARKQELETSLASLTAADPNDPQIAMFRRLS